MVRRPPCAPHLGQAAVSERREEITTSAPVPISEAVPGVGGAHGRVVVMERLSMSSHIAADWYPGTAATSTTAISFGEDAGDLMSAVMSAVAVLGEALHEVARRCVWIGSWSLMYLEIMRWHHVRPSLAFNSYVTPGTGLRP